MRITQPAPVDPYRHTLVQNHVLLPSHAILPKHLLMTPEAPSNFSPPFIPEPGKGTRIDFLA